MKPYDLRQQHNTTLLQMNAAGKAPASAPTPTKSHGNNQAPDYPALPAHGWRSQNLMWELSPPPSGYTPNSKNLMWELSPPPAMVPRLHRMDGPSTLLTPPIVLCSQQMVGPSHSTQPVPKVPSWNCVAM